MMNLPGMRQFVDQYLASGLIRRASDILLNIRLQRMFEVFPHVDQDLAVGDPRHREFAREEAGAGVGRVVQIGEEYPLDWQGATELEGMFHRCQGSGEGAGFSDSGRRFYPTRRPDSAQT